VTEYVILVNTDDGGPRFQVVGKTEAAGVSAAIRTHLKKDELAEDSSGMYVAVPARSWRPVKVAVEQALKFS
jgi:hypothetical protein